VLIGRTLPLETVVRQPAGGMLLGRGGVAAGSFNGAQNPSGNAVASCGPGGLLAIPASEGCSVPVAGLVDGYRSPGHRLPNWGSPGWLLGVNVIRMLAK
jgi:hypothetical protein